MNQKYKVLNESGISIAAGNNSAVDSDVIPMGEVVELDSENEQTKRFVEGGFVELVEEVKEPVLVDYVVVKGPFANPQAEVFQTGNVIQFPEGDEFAASAVENGLIMTKADHDALPKDEVVNGAGLPTAPSVAGSTEPRKRYRGKVVLVESDRIVGEQTFKHIRLEDGDELDLTAAEYAGEVHVSFPPQE